LAGIFISFEGIEGAGKTTQHKKLCDYLNRKNINFISTGEPGGTEIGKYIREIILSNKFNKMDDKTELFLFAADRHQHLSEIIKPFLKKDYLVITDRYADSTFAYQAYGRGIDLNLIRQINELATEGLYPHMTFFLDISPEKSLSRLLKRAEYKGEHLDRIEQEKLKFFQKVREGYMELVRLDPERFKILNAEDDLEKIHIDIVNHLENFMKQKGDEE
jgi:dTMP kinase